MENVTPRYALIGSGRAAQHLEFYLKSLGLSVRAWSRKLEPRPGAEWVTVAREATHVWALVSDRAVEPVIQDARAALQKADVDPARLIWLHASGNLVTPLAHGCHPLVSFASGRLYEPDFYRRLPIIVDRDAPPFDQLLSGLPNPHFKVDPRQRPLYHALCVLSGCFTTLLWQKLFRDFETRLLMPGKIAAPYLESVMKNLLADPDRAATGPLNRGDVSTIQSNLAALEGDPFQKIYRAFVEAESPRK